MIRDECTYFIFSTHRLLPCQYMSTISKLKTMFAKPVVVGLVSALGAKAMGQDFSVDVRPIGMLLSAPVFYGVLGLGSSLAAETLHQWVLPYLPQSEMAVKMESAALSPVLVAATNVIAIKILTPAMLTHPDVGYTAPIIIGAGAEFVGSYAFENFIKTMDWMR